jgi:tetratricopeptide (TPR) repeat protein
MSALPNVRPYQPCYIERDAAQAILSRILKQRVAIVAAPEGYGKTQLVQTLDQPGLPVLEIKANCSFEHFVSNIVRSTSPLARGMSRSVARVYAEALENESGPAHLAQWFSKYLTGTKRILVIDGGDRATDDRIADFVKAAIDTSPFTIRWVIVGRNLQKLRGFVLNDDHVLVNEEHLKLTFPEARELARRIVPGHTDGELFAVVRKAQGSISRALFLFQCLRYHVDDVAAPWVSFEDIIDRVYTELTSEEQRETMTSVLLEDEGNVQTTKIFAQINSIYSRLRSKAPYLFEIDGRNLQSCVRHRLREETRRLIDTNDTTIFLRAAAALEAQGDMAAAVALYWSVRAIDRLLGVVERYSTIGLEGEHMHVLREMIAMLPRDVQKQQPLLIALQGADAFNRGRNDESKALYEEALAMCPPGISQQSIRYWYSTAAIAARDISLLQRLLRPGPDFFRTPLTLRGAMLAMLAVSYSLAGKREQANIWIARACKISDAKKDSALAARVYQQATFIALQDRNLDLAHTRALEAITHAEACGWPHVAAITYGALHRIAVERGWSAEMAHYGRSVALNAERSGNTRLQYQALATLLDHAVERGDEAAYHALLEEIAALRNAVFPEGFDPDLPILAARAMHHAWNRDVDTAYLYVARLLDTYESTQGDPNPIAFAEGAVYAAAAGRRNEAHRALALYRKAVLQVSPSKELLRARTHEALALWILGKETEATLIFRNLYDVLPISQERNTNRAYAEYVCALLDSVSTGTTPYPVALEAELKNCGWGGLGRMLRGVIARVYAIKIN